MSDSARSSIRVPLAPARTFAAFTEGFGDWWPPEYTWSQQKLVSIGIEAGEGGMCFERGPFGFRSDWGRVLIWEPPGRLVFSWQIGPTRAPVPDPDRAGEVEVRFEPDGDGTQVELVHRGFERHGDGAEDYRAAMDSPQGWDLILGRFACSVS